MDVTHQTNDEQATLWNGLGGRAWVETQDLLDQVLKPLEDLLVEAVFAGSGSRVLDVGCGTGCTTIAVAPHAFEPASFDMIISRLGVMFFDDPVRAFVNLHRAASGDAELRFIAFRSAAENPFMTTAERAAAPLLPNVPARRPDAPGQFAFADKRRVGSILQESGWVDIDVHPIDVACTLPEKELVGYFTRLGPEEADDRTRTQVIKTVRAAFDPYVNGAEIRFTAACWMVGARAPLAPKELANV
jgi:SAM-dependent methyltransferase